jgi:hypothetical protein
MNFTLKKDLEDGSPFAGTKNTMGDFFKNL